MSDHKPSIAKKSAMQGEAGKMPPSQEGYSIESIIFLWGGLLSALAEISDHKPSIAKKSAMQGEAGKMPAPQESYSIEARILL